MAGILTTQAPIDNRNTGEVPLLTIITVVRNGGDTIERAIKSVANQKTSAIEYIVLDGASTDDTVQRIKRHEKHIDYWQSQPDAGIAQAFNHGLKLARGRYVGFLNADDWYQNDALAQVTTHLETAASPANQIDWLCGAIKYHDPGSSFQRVEQAKPDDLPKYMSVYHPSMFIAKSIYERVGDYDESLSYAMDSDWVHRAVCAGVVPKAVPIIIANMSLGGTSNRNLGAALIEYRTSVINTGLASATQATYYLLRQWLVHSALKFAPLRAFSDWRNRGTG